MGTRLRKLYTIHYGLFSGWCNLQPVGPDTSILAAVLSAVLGGGGGGVLFVLIVVIVSFMHVE